MVRDEQFQAMQAGRDWPRYAGAGAGFGQGFGGLGDIFGARKIYMIGLALFTLASLLSGCASSMATCWRVVIIGSKPYGSGPPPVCRANRW